MTPGDFDTAAIAQVAHRPWPLPGSRWVMTQTWHDLLFAHWPVAPSDLRPLLPAALPLDLRDGAAWLGLVPFRMTNVAPRGAPAVPGLSAFLEMNVRTYVTVGGKPGVYFLSLDASNPVAVAGARAAYRLPYYLARMAVATADDGVRYRSRRCWSRARFSARYAPIGAAAPAAPGSLEHFLTERYCLYTIRGERPYRLEIHHAPWRLQAADLDIRANTMAEIAGVALPGCAPLLHFARRQDVVTWPLCPAG